MGKHSGMDSKFFVFQILEELNSPFKKWGKLKILILHEKRYFRIVKLKKTLETVKGYLLIASKLFRNAQNNGI